MDRVSSLPDEVLGHILSFLTTKESALTSILAKRWRNLFASVPKLVIDDSMFLHPEEGKRDREEIIQSFMSFVDRVLALQGDSPVKEVSLKCKAGVDSERVDRWICNVLQRGVSELDLCVSFGDDYRLPLKILKSRTLVELSLGGGIKLDGWDEIEDGVIFLPMLKTLNLDTVEFCIDQFEIFLRGCPVLEKLDMVKVEWEDWMETVSSASLKFLTIKSDTCLKELSFDTPNLVFLDYYEYVAGDYPVVNLENVVNARINLLANEDQVRLAREPANDEFEDEQGAVVLQFSNAKKLMKGLRNVKKLMLSPCTLEVLSLCTEAMPVFKNLTFLAILSHEDLGWQAMPALLKNCPNLKTLGLWGLLHYQTDKCGDACDCIAREDKGSSLSSCPVKRLDIQGFRGTPRELKMIKHFLISFPCLEEMEIHAERNGPTNFEFPGMFKIVAELLVSYNELTTCDVQFMGCLNQSGYGSSGYSWLLSCPVNFLKITKYSGTIKELEHLQHFLGKLSSLELLEVTFWRTDDKDESQITKDLLMLPRASFKCNIKFVK